MSAANAQFESDPMLPLAATVSIGDISLALDGLSVDDVNLGSGLQAFCCENGDPNIEVSVSWAGRIRSRTVAPAFDSGAVWTLFQDESHLVFDFSSPVLGTHPYKRLVVDKGFRHAQLMMNSEVLEQHRPIHPLAYPADELLITNYLASYGLGVEVHGCGLVDSESGGHLFLGHSGSGKSTTARLWETFRNPEILSDDRIILRIEAGELWMYGTPWHGEGQFASPGKSKINKIFILQHGASNEATPLSRSCAAGELFARSFPPFHSPAGLHSVIEFLDRVVNAVPCYEFRFVPDARAVEAVLELDYANACS